MKTLEVKQEVSYWWRRDDQGDINESHIEALEEHAEERINEMRTEGYTGGELITSVRMDDEDGEDGIAYSGWWDLKTIHPDTHAEKVKAAASDLLDACKQAVEIIADSYGADDIDSFDNCQACNILKKAINKTTLNN